LVPLAKLVDSRALEQSRRLDVNDEGATAPCQEVVRTVVPLLARQDAGNAEWLAGDARHVGVEVHQENPVALQQALATLEVPVGGRPPPARVVPPPHRTRRGGPGDPQRCPKPPPPQGRSAPARPRPARTQGSHGRHPPAPRGDNLSGT